MDEFEDPQMPAKPHKRRIPRQERSQRRLDAIVAGAAKLFADQGFKATTMESIARDADSSIGSLYQFFPNKLAVFRAVAEKCLARTGEYYVELLGDAPQARPWQSLLDDFVDGFFEFELRDPYFRAVIKNMELYGEFAEADQAMLQGFIHTTSSLFAVWAPHIPASRRLVLATMIVEVISAVLIVSNRQSPEMARAMVSETKVMLRRYLEPMVSGTSAEPT